ncbi:MAG: cation:proton antiporter [Gammaproteobacteria bacterium]
MHEQLVYIAALVIFTGIAVQWLAWRFRFPAIVLLTASGFILGPVLGWVQPERDFGALLQPMVQLAVAIILFEGGLNLRFHELAQAGMGVRRLVSLGLVLSFAAGSFAARFVGGLSWPSATVFGAIIVVTGPTVIMPLLRQARLRPRPASLLKWEGIVNDPLGALLAVIVFEYLIIVGAEVSATSAVFEVVTALVGAGLLGWVSGVSLGYAYRNGWVPVFLKDPLMLAVVLATFAVGNLLLHEAGLLTVTVLGVALGNAGLPSIQQLRRFKESITIALVSVLFIVMTANLDPVLLAALDWRGAALVLALIFVVRPVVIAVATWGTDLTWQERALVGWIAPRGIVAAAVAGAFSQRMVEAGFEDAAKILPLVFALIVTTVVLHGFSIGVVSRRLGLASARDDGLLIVGASPWAIDLAQQLKALDIPVRIVDASWHRLRPARLAGIDIHFGQVISESADETLDLSDTGLVLAATDNDAYNALVCTRFANEFNRSAVFQLAMVAEDEHGHKGLAPGARGQRAFSDASLYEALLERYFEGWRFQKTGLTETFDFDRYLKEIDQELFAAMVVRSNGRLVFANGAYQPKAGDIVINFLPQS